MHLRVVIFLSILAVKCDQTMTHQMPDLLQTVKNGFIVARDLFKIFLGKGVFRDVLALAAKLTVTLFPPQPIPPIPEPWWGDEQHTDVTDTSIRPFKVHFSDEIISDLRGRIIHRRKITPSLRGVAHTYGTNADYLAQLLHYWAHEYHFKEREDWLNSFPQYTTNIQGLSIHYIHVKPPNPHGKKVLPLLLLHGWPATAFEYVHVIRHLLVEREHSDFVFEMIAPDLPGFGYSEAPNKIGMTTYQMGIIMKNLMRRLGWPRFYVHAGDVGQIVADNMAVLFPDRVIGLHTNFAFSLRPETLVKYLLGQLYPPAVVEAPYEDRMYPLMERARSYLENTGYFHVQASKPDNVGHGVDDSPVAQTSWLVENIITGAGARTQLAFDGNLTSTYDMRDWFDSFTVYWDAQCMATSMRVYAELLAVVRDPLIVAILMTPTTVPFAAIRFRNEIIYQPDEFLRDKYPNLVQATSPDFGGHFAGYEAPGVLADSIWTAVDKMEVVQHGGEQL